VSASAETRARPDAYESVRRDALARIEQRRLRPEVHLHEIRVEVGAAVEAYQRRAQRGEEVPLHQPAETGERILRSITDFGALTGLLVRRDVEEIFIEGARVTYLDADGHLRGLDTPTSEVENRQILERLLAVTERQLTTKHPIVQARVLDGTARLTAAIPPIADRTSATLRRYTVRDVTLDQLVERTTLSRAAARFLGTLMHVNSRVAISGEPGAGKTTLAAALLAAIPAGHCVRCCEEIRELAVPLTHGAYYEVRPAALDGTGEISLRDLVKFVLAMRPDRIVVGEVRGAEAFELTRAVNAGCGFLCTVHANGAVESLHALVNAALMAGENVTERVVRRVLARSLDVVVHVKRDDASDRASTRRRVAEIVAVVPSLGEDFTVEPLFVLDSPGGSLGWTGVVPDHLAARLDRALPRGATLRGLIESEYR
jgi:pilus assembly protein CpaF